MERKKQIRNPKIYERKRREEKNAMKRERKSVFFYE